VVDWHKKTVKVYDDSAEALAEYFSGISARVKDIEIALKLAGRHKDKRARVVEIGCGDGRDAEEIIKRVGYYEGIDPSKGILKIASQRIPESNLFLSDAVNYEYPKDLDVVYAFASLLHVAEEDFRIVMVKVASALKKGGVFYLSLKERPEYSKAVKNDMYGERMFYFYNPKVIKAMAPKSLKSVYVDHQTRGDTGWFTIALQKI
jgi:SAM-dependent methyltransferase